MLHTYQPTGREGSRHFGCCPARCYCARSRSCPPPRPGRCVRRDFVGWALTGHPPKPAQLLPTLISCCGWLGAGAVRCLSGSLARFEGSTYRPGRMYPAPARHPPPLPGRAGSSRGAVPRPSAALGGWEATIGGQTGGSVEINPTVWHIRGRARRGAGLAQEYKLWRRAAYRRIGKPHRCKGTTSPYGS
jgi:hypothetical protein